MIQGRDRGVLRASLERAGFFDAELAFVRSASEAALEVFELERTHLARALVLMDEHRDLPVDLAAVSR